MYQRTGQTYDSTAAASLALSYCDELYLIRDALDATAANLTRTGFQRTVEAMGGRFAVAGVPAVDLTPNRHAPVVDGFDMRWDPACPCIRYVGRHRIA